MAIFQGGVIKNERKNKINSEFKLTYIKKWMFVCQCKKNQGDVVCGGVGHDLAIDSM